MVSMHESGTESVHYTLGVSPVVLKSEFPINYYAIPSGIWRPD